MTGPARRLPVLADPYRPPETRDECVTGCWNTGSRDERMTGRASCRALRCRHNLLVMHGDERPGRRNDGRAPDWTLSGANENAFAPSCSLDVADTGPKRAAEVGAVLGCDRRRVQQLVRSGLKRLAERGVDVGAFEAMLRRDGE